MKAKKGYLRQKWQCPAVGKWLKYYFYKRTCKKKTREFGELDEDEEKEVR